MNKKLFLIASEIFKCHPKFYGASILIKHYVLHFKSVFTMVMMISLHVNEDNPCYH